MNEIKSFVDKLSSMTKYQRAVFEYKLIGVKNDYMEGYEEAIDKACKQFCKANCNVDVCKFKECEEFRKFKKAMEL